MKKVISLTHQQAVTLECYILMTTTYRQKELECWEVLAAEANPEGTPKFPNAQSNADFWANLSDDLDEIIRIIDRAELEEDT